MRGLELQVRLTCVSLQKSELLTLWQLHAGKRTLDTSAGTGGSVAFIGIPCTHVREIRHPSELTERSKSHLQVKREEEDETKNDSISISFGEMTSGFVPAGFKQGRCYLYVR